jgi:Ca2+-binding EF-hand superfamily protein
MEVKHEFEKVDTNKNGFIEKAELMQHYKLKDPEAQKVITDFDFDKNGKLDFCEFKMWRWTVEFHEKDSNKNGFLEPKEIKKGYNLKKEQVDEIFKHFDKNKDGKLTFGEWKMWKTDRFWHAEFHHMDTNKNGFLEPKEIEDGLKMKKEDVAKAFKAFDKNKDGKLSFDEYKTWKVHELFTKIDTNKNGSIEKSELMKAWHKTKEEVDEIYQQFDTNKNGKLSFEEFFKMF